MPKLRQLKSTFAAGEVSPAMALRRDTQQYFDGSKQLRNFRLLNQGGAQRRPGSWWLATLAGAAQLVAFDFSADQRYVLAFGAGRMDAFLPDGTAAGSLTSQPWTADHIGQMAAAHIGDTVILAHMDLPMQVIRRTGASSWSCAALAFTQRLSGVKSQPYHKFADADVTVTPSSTTGSVTLTASAATWVAGHVGTSIRWINRQIDITAVTNSTTATGTVIQTLPSTVSLTVASSSYFSLGDVVEGSVTGAKGEVVAIPDATHLTVTITDGLIVPTTSDTMVGPDGKSTVSAVSTVSPVGNRDWQEQLCSSVHGYFGCAAIARGRLWFAGHKALPNAVLASAIGDYYSFDLGTAADGDAIFELIGDSETGLVKQIVNAEQLVILTDRGAHYIPERQSGTSQPIKPSSISFSKIGSDRVGRAPAALFDSGVLFVETGGARVGKIQPTGNLNRAWQVIDVSLLAAHLIVDPVGVSTTETFGTHPERYGFFVNSDGTMAVYSSVEDEQVRGWTPWDTDGEYISVLGLSGDVFTVVKRTIAGVDTYILELFDQELTLDATLTLANATGTLAPYAGHRVQAVKSTWAFGGIDVAAGTGVISIPTSVPGPFMVGLDYTPMFETLPPEIQLPDGTMAGPRKRIVRVWTHTLTSARFSVNGLAITAYRGGDDFTAPPPLRTEVNEFRVLGWDRDPTVTLTQADPVPLIMLGISIEVSI